MKHHGVNVKNRQAACRLQENRRLMHQSGLNSLTPLIQGLLLLTCLTILLAGLHMAAPLVNQVLLALFLAVMLDPLIELPGETRTPSTPYFAISDCGSAVTDRYYHQLAQRLSTGVNSAQSPGIGSDRHPASCSDIFSERGGYFPFHRSVA